MYNKAVSTCFFLFDYVPDQCKTKKVVMRLSMNVWQH